MISRREDNLLKAITCLEGGLTACGSTCGVITGGSMGLALLHDKALQENTIEAEMGLLSLIEEYIKCFKKNINTTLCRERTGVDFHKITGQMRYMIPGDKSLKCLSNISIAAKCLHTLQNKDFPKITTGQSKNKTTPIHCAQAVLKGVKAKTNIGDPMLERLSIVLDGGVGLSGGLCGAIAGSTIAIGIIHGSDIHNINIFQKIWATVKGHINLLLNTPIGFPEPFSISNEIGKKFRLETNDLLECKKITGKEFGDWETFQNYITSSDKCRGLIDSTIGFTIEAIERSNKKI